MAKPTNTFLFPVTTLKYINVVKPDSHFDPANPKFQVTAVYEPSVGRKLIADLEQKFPEFKGKFKPTRDNEDNYLFKATQKKFINWTKDGVPHSLEMKPILLVMGEDGKAVPLEGRDPWGGSTGEVAVELAITKTARGESLAIRLKGVRFHTIQSGSGEEAGSGEDPLFAFNAGTTTSSSPETSDLELSEEEMEKAFG